MKTKKLLLMAAMLLTSVCAFAQSSEPVEGDVNKDGKVDVADIVKVIDIMAAAEQPQPTTYYWYAGQTQPTNMSSDPQVDDENFTNNKWHTLNGTTIGTTITNGTSGQDWYVAVPACLDLYPTASDYNTSDMSWDNYVTDNSLNQISINGVLYTVWRTNSTGGRQAVYMAVLRAIYYFGITQPTADNYKLLPVGQSLARINGSRYRVESNEYIYFLCPTGAITNEQRENAMLDEEGNNVGFSQEIDTNSISGYSIYKQYFENAGILKLNIE